MASEERTDQGRRGRPARPSRRRTPDVRTFSMAWASDAPLAAVEAELLIQGWRRVGRGADLLLIDGRAVADDPNSRGSSAYRLLLVGEGADPTPALRAGDADDVIVLGSPAGLRVRLLVAARAIEARRRAASSVAEARRWGLVDELSGLGTRRALATGLRSFCGLEETGIACALLIVDIDQFKSVNDRYGHVEGDRLIRKTGSAIAEVIRDTDAGYRFGGDEFILLLRNTSGPDAVAIAERLRFAVGGLSLGTDGYGPEARVTISVGVVALPRDAERRESKSSRPPTPPCTRPSGRDATESGSVSSLEPSMRRPSVTAGTPTATRISRSPRWRDTRQRLPGLQHRVRGRRDANGPSPSCLQVLDEQTERQDDREARADGDDRDGRDRDEDGEEPGDRKCPPEASHHAGHMTRPPLPGVASGVASSLTGSPHHWHSTRVSRAPPAHANWPSAASHHVSDRVATRMIS
jgi:diguanylate cyclase (GGDEF)-like protein